ncbi:MAG: SUMF1/EgtB/PvdO family nonheme iron enzyme [Calditrichaeota bacterium]|nr:SUMF1/EgtB/PvdO family nonheme iron enzyme [Calditrichota bacterium]MCB0268338.1 SUMF1/EgtB/PvdO family nonheme iron enzyme [Calditrichota bacterium]
MWEQLLTDPFINSVVSGTLSGLAANFIPAAGRRLKETFSDKGKNAMERCLKNGLIAIAAAARDCSEAEKELLKDIFRNFFHNPSVNTQLIKLTIGKQPERDELYFLFEDAGYVPGQLPGLDFKQAIGAFEVAFLETAAQEKALQSTIQTGTLQELLKKQGESLAFLRGDTNEEHYLKTLISESDRLDLSLMHESRQHRSASGGSGAVRISDVFTRLYLSSLFIPPSKTLSELISGSPGVTNELVHLLLGLNKDKATQMLIQSKRLVLQHRSSKEEVPIQAVEAVAAAKKLVVLGQPGGGKSSLINHLAVEMAQRRLGQHDNTEKFPGWQREESPLPVRIILRRFAAWLPKEIPNVKAGLVWDYLKEQLGQFGCRDYFPALQQQLTKEGGIVFFDGLDEVGIIDAQNKRTLIMEAIQSFANPLEKCRIIITCREYAYKANDAWRLPLENFPVVELALFDLKQMKDFCHTWYKVVGPTKGWTGEQAAKEADDLFNAIKSKPHLHELAQYPLLITLMAEVHGSEGRLPEDRADLYERAVELLLVHWESRITRETARGQVVSEGLYSQLDVDRKILRDVLERVAFLAHERQEKEKERDEQVADIPREDLREELFKELKNLDKAQKAIDFIQERAGLLLARSNNTYAFPHRTFQEYLAACHIAKQSDFVQMLNERLQRDYTWWQEVYLLTAGYVKRTPANVSSLVSGILAGTPRKNKIADKTLNLAILAAQALRETRFAEHVRREKPAGLYTSTFKNVQTWLDKAMDSGKRLQAKQRVAAGNALGRFGDPRVSVHSVDQIEFCYIPGGPFYMGSEENKNEKPPHLNETLNKPFWVARYPVTVAQYRQFLIDSGKESADPAEIIANPTHPVVEISWYDAIEFCKWLNRRWKEINLLPEGYQVSLPTESQWEKTARGGVQIPKKAIITSVGKLIPDPELNLIDNPIKQRRYPWGDKDDPNMANFNRTGINTTSPVGCFADGICPYGCEEMSGNSWEWTISLWGKKDEPYYKYPYQPDDGRENMDASRDVARVVRGGSFDDDPYHVRCSIRGRGYPGYRGLILGFRLSLSPSISDSDL